MKILHLIPYSPLPPTFGGALRIYHILSHLCEHHDVTIAGFCDPEDEKELVDHFPSLEGKTHFVKYSLNEFTKKLMMVYSLFTPHSYWYNITITRKMQEKIDRLLADQEFDIILSEFPVMASFHFNSSAVKILDSHNVEYNNYERMASVPGNWLRNLYYKNQAQKFFFEEIEACKKQDAIFVTSDRDKALYDQDVPDVPKFVVPNGVDFEYFQPQTAGTEPHSLVFVGTMGYLPNSDAMNYFLDKVFPLITEKLPQAKIYVVGNNPPQSLKDRSNGQVVVTDFVEDVRPYVDRASVYVVPLRMGGGTRLKILEALAMKKPIVTTTIGCEGIDVSDGKHVLIGDDPQEFAGAVINLLEDEQMAKKLVTNGHQLIQEKYGWQTIGDAIEQNFKHLRNRKRERTNPSLVT